MIHDFPLTEWFFYAVRWLYGVLGNSYFLTILIVTLILRLIQVYPDIKSRQTQQKQAALQPEIDKLKKKYADNPQKLNQEQNKLMKENGIGCLAGCLPMLLTLPLFFCFLAAFRFWGYEQTVKLTYETIENRELAQETYDSFKFLWINNIWQPDSGFEPVVTPADTVATYGSSASACSCSGSSKSIGDLVLFHKGYTDLRGNYVSGEQIWQTFVENGLAEGEFGSEGMKLVQTEESQKKYDELMSVYKKGKNNGWFILPILATGFQFLMAWLGQRQTKKQNPGTAQQPGMNAMMYLFPVMSLFICMSSTSAFSLYWVLSSVFQIISSTIINRLLSKKAQNAGEITAK